ncbi:MULTISPECIES: aminotransferase class I/II-fold pyridoxal phosphate-dependent enzyme [unclassified Streptomyces]|uniref:aminotransferase class I/II-fold pyridoxal phosphate-dependent enzyme n=1 Tax=unclassified Streptomyces TaxID=2593676 RepID=UPI002E280282|nr:aminotransferase class I/II-fold pyridoxal phosphate-dependent enzyme [Streptomyces sp. NBC_01429]
MTAPEPAGGDRAAPQPVGGTGYDTGEPGHVPPRPRARTVDLDGFRFPLGTETLGLSWHPRERRPDTLNLKSCELQHPWSDRLVAGELAALPLAETIAYPFQDRVLDVLGTYHGLDSGHILLTAGSDNGIGLVVDALVRPAGRLLLEEPAFEAWRHYAGLRRVRVTGVPGVTGTPPTADPAPLLAALRATPGPAVAAVTNPGSPSGLLHSPETMRRFAETARERGHLLVIDEAYGDFVHTSHAPLVTEFPNVVVVHSYSKAFALAGVRIAALLVHPDLRPHLGRFRPENAVGAPGVALLERLAPQRARWREIWRDVRAVRQEFTERVLSAHPGWQVLQPGANFATFWSPDPATADAARDHLAAHRVRIRSLSDLPGLGGCFRVSLADRPAMERVAELLDAVADHHRVPVTPVTVPAAPPQAVAHRPPPLY